MPRQQRITVNKAKTAILEYEGKALSDALMTKHNETAYITVTSKRLKNGQVGCRFEQLLYCKKPTNARFLKMAQRGNVYLDLAPLNNQGQISIELDHSIERLKESYYCSY